MVLQQSRHRKRVITILKCLSLSVCLKNFLVSSLQINPCTLSVTTKLRQQQNNPASHQGYTQRIWTNKLHLSARNRNLPSVRCEKFEDKRKKTALPSVAAEANGEKETHDVDTESMPAAVFNVCKAQIGSGILALPYAVSKVGDQPRVLIGSSILVVIMGILSAYSFFNIGRMCNDNGAALSLGEFWEKEVDPNTAWIVSIACFMAPFCVALTYSIAMADTISSLLQSMSLPAILSNRSSSLMAVTLFVLYPLCNLRSLAALSPFSLVGVISVLLTAVVMCMKLVSGAYGPGSLFLNTLRPGLRPSFNKIGIKPIGPSWLMIMSIAANSFLLHFNVPAFYTSLKNNTMKRFGRLTALGFTSTAFLNLAIMVLGFLTFGGNCDGLILNNYSIVDKGAMLCRIFLVLSMVGSYPLMVSSMREEFVKLKYKGEMTDSRFRKWTTIFVSLITGVALVMKDPGFVVSLNGALMASAVIYIFPSIIYLKQINRRIREGSLRNSTMLRIERLFNKSLIGFGVFSCFTGGMATILATFFPSILA